ncbi:MAG: hypothetical protein K2P17_03385 [Helicobacteraceae bacterium]|nr:hypothetical protein [Helicobacteraceae bacterium]
MKYTQQDKARILKIMTMTLQRLKYTKLAFVIIKAGLNARERLEIDELHNKEIEQLIIDPQEKHK